MPGSAIDSTAVGRLAAGVRTDARRMTRQALQLRDSAARLRGGSRIPDWFERAMREQIDRCMVAAAELERAAERLESHAESLDFKAAGQ